MRDTYNDKKAYDCMVKARAALIRHKGWQGAFYAPLVMRLDFVERNDVPTMATDAKHLFYNAEYACNLSEDERIGVIVHETNHCASLHHSRMGKRPLMQWNVACDYPTNENVLKAGFVLPKGLLINPAYYGMSAEDVYNVEFPPIPPAKPEPEDESEDAGDDGNPGKSETDGGSTGQDDESENPADAGDEAGGQGGKQSPANASGQASGGQSSGQEDASGNTETQELGIGGILPAYQGDEAGEADASPERWEQAVREATSLAKARGWGAEMPDAIREVLSEIEQGKHDWREQLRQFTDNRAAVKSSWKRPNRRFATANFVMPGNEKDGIDHALWMIDTSGSMDSHWLSCIRGEVQEALDAGFIDKITVVCIDTSVKAIFEYDTGDAIDFEPVGRGGTEFAPAFNWIRSQDTEFTCCIYLTDLDCNNFGIEPECPVLWAVYGRYWNRPVPFGEVIRLSE